MEFKDLGLNNDLLKAVTQNGFKEPTPIQAKTIPLILEGNDVIGQAQTGTGKTAAFSLPILQNIDLDNPNIQALVVSPTRELAMQTQNDMYTLGKNKGTKSQAVYGGSDIRRQIRGLKSHPQVIVGTPGRILDHINRRTMDLSNINYLVLDEADDMLDMGFLEDIKNIIRNLPKQRQTMLFSATMPSSIKKIGVQFMQSPKQITIQSKGITTDLIDQYYIRSRQFEKFDLMTRFFDVQAPKVTIVFCRTKRRVNEVAQGLVKCGYRAAGLQGDLTQVRRSKILQDFKNGRMDVLVATDVAARGIDVSGVTHVYNYDIPQDPDSYVHRIGRTGRAGNHGVSMTFVEPNEIDYLRRIEKLTKTRMLPLKPPSEDEALTGQLKNAEEKIGGLINHKDTEKFEDQIDELLDKYQSKDLVAVLLSKMTRNHVKVRITPERPLPKHKQSRSHHNGHRGKNKRSFHNNRRNNNYRNNKRGNRRFNSNHRSNSNKSFTIKRK